MMGKMKIIGIAGTNGSGKDTVGHLIAERDNYLFVSVTDLLRAEARQRGVPVEREQLRTISAQWRRDHGLGILIDKAIELAKQQNYAGVVMASLRNPGENDRVHELGGVVVWVDADPEVRYARVYSRQRTAEDDKTYEEFLAEEQAEMQSSGDETTLNMAAVKAQSDIFIENNSDSLEELKEAINKALPRS
jgi:dephospho-CoA kinase